MKTEIPESIQEVLRCSECDEFLSCGPVYLVHGTSEAICGRCNPQSSEKKDPSPNSGIRNKSRNIQYEAAAKLLSFPCRYSNQGCHEKLDFSEDGANIHEHDCEFRNFFCPIVPRHSCGWVGSCTKLTEHCRNIHPTHFFENPFVLPRLDLTKSNLTNFLVSTFNFLFLVHIKICVSSGKLFHSIRIFGNSEILDKFSYSLEIEGNNKKLIENGSVLPTGIMMMQESSSSSILMNSLLDILRCKYIELKFTITIQTLLTFNCVNCAKSMKNDVDSKFCEECNEKVIKCKFHEIGCSFLDVNRVKCVKHERYFCDYETKCFNCGMNFIDGIIEHLNSSTYCRETVKSDLNSVVRVSFKSGINNKFILFSSNNMGIIISEYHLINSYLLIYLYTALPLHELANYKCSIELTDPQTKHTQVFEPQIVYNNYFDWHIKEQKPKFPSCNNLGIDMKINIDKR